MNDFLQDVPATSRVLWALMILGSVPLLSLGLYGFWEAALKLAARTRRRRPASEHDHPPSASAQ